MGKDKVAILLIFIAALAAGITVYYLRESDGDTGAGAGPLRPSVAGEFRGICLQLHSSDPDHPHEQFIDEISRTGANTLGLVVNAYQENGASTSIFIEARKTPPVRRIKKLIVHAKKRGLRVVLMPILLLENPREGDWRGTIQPTDWDDWWEDYTNYILHYAHVAQDAGADVFLVGSELVSTETLTKRWRRLIAKVRAAYKGRLSYSSNWDHYEVIEWWDDLDIIGMTTYYDLARGKKPTLENMLKTWGDIREEILTWQKKVKRPILFTEVGWPNQVTAAEFPWDYTRSPDKPDPRQQADCFRAFFRTWFGRKEVAGYLIWEWRNSPSEKGGPDDTGYFPGGKPAMKVISQYFTKPSPWPTTARAVEPPPRPTEPTTQPAAKPATRPSKRPLFGAADN